MEGDLLSGITGDRHRRRWLEFILDPNNSSTAPLAQPAQKVAYVMTKRVMTATDDTPVDEVVKIMTTNGIKRIPVVKENKVVGIISRADLLRGLALEAKMMPQASVEDLALRERVVETLSKDGTGVSINVLVQGGVVELRGPMPTADVGKLIHAARNVPGVKEVVDKLVVIESASERK